MEDDSKIKSAPEMIIQNFHISDEISKELQASGTIQANYILYQKMYF